MLTLSPAWQTYATHPGIATVGLRLYRYVAELDVSENPREMRVRRSLFPSMGP